MKIGNNLMHKRRSPLPAVPEELLVTIAKKKAICETGKRLLSLRRVIALAENFKRELFVQLERERPEFSCAGANVLLYGKYAEVIKYFLKSSFDKERLRFSDDVFNTLNLDFLHYLGARSRRDESDARLEVSLRVSD